MLGIILAAGSGTRLGDITKDTPKCLLDISGKCSLGRLIESFKYAGIRDIVVVVGYKSESILKFLESYKDVYIIENEIWEKTNNAVSLELALKFNKEIFKSKDILVSNADVVCYKEMIVDIVNSKHRNAMGCVRKRILNDEDMKVLAQHGTLKIELVSKKIDEEDVPFGEFTGIFKMGKEYLEDFSNILYDRIENDRKCWFESAINQLCLKNDIFVEDVSHYPFIEVDFPEDLEEARDRFPYDQPVWEQGRRHESITKGQRNIDDAISLMITFRDVLQKYGIRYWLNWGLLLGCTREGLPLKYDTDLDICIDKHNEYKLWDLVVPEMRKFRCFIPNRFQHCDNDCFIIRDGEAIECNTVDKIGNRYVYSPERCKLSCPEKYLNELTTINVKGHIFSVPSFREEMLAGWYGKDWKIPQSTKPKSF